MNIIFLSVEPLVLGGPFQSIGQGFSVTAAVDDAERNLPLITSVSKIICQTCTNILITS